MSFFMELEKENKLSLISKLFANKENLQPQFIENHFSGLYGNFDILAWYIDQITYIFRFAAIGHNFIQN